MEVATFCDYFVMESLVPLNVSDSEFEVNSMKWGELKWLCKWVY